MSEMDSPEAYRVRLLALLEAQMVPVVDRAYELARRAHAGQWRDGGQVAYLVHPLHVALLLAGEFGCRESLPLCVALLHDVLEDSPTAAEEIELACGAEVAAGVRLLTKVPPGDEGKAERDRRYFAAIASAASPVRLVKCADRLDNLRSMPELQQPERLARYIEETRRYVLPIAAQTEPTLFHALLAACDDAVPPTPRT